MYRDIQEGGHSSLVSADSLAIMMTEGEEDKYDRYAYINLWRNIADNSIENDHLAMLDEKHQPNQTIILPEICLMMDILRYSSMD